MPSIAHVSRLLLAGAAILLALASGFISYQMYRQQKLIETSSRYNLAWTVSQSVTEFLRLQHEIARAALQEDTEAVQLRFDICVNRISLLRSGAAGAFVAGDAALKGIVDRFEAGLRRIEPLIPMIHRREAAIEALRVLEPRAAELMRLSAASNVHSAGLAAVDQAELVSLHWQFTAYVIMLALNAVALIAFLLRHMKELRATKQKLEESAQDLQTALAKADAAGEAKARFLAAMSHEVRTPMNAVLGLAGALLDETLTSRQREIVTTISASGDSLLRILNDILDFSKLDAGYLTLEDGPFSPVELTRETAALLAPRAESTGLTLMVDTDPGPEDWVLGDGGRIRQVLLNLVSNAVKFTETGFVVVSLRRIGPQDGAMTLEWTVRDTGIGIPPDRIGSLFGEFVQADSSISHRYGGTGLGLAISKRLIDRMNGTIGVESKPNEGTTFRVRITLPIAEHPPQAQPAEGDPVPLFEAAMTRLGRPLRLLLAEDNPTNQFVFSQSVKDLAVNLDLAADGNEAVEAAISFRYDVICMDMRMPVLDGLGAARRIRAQGGRLATIPIIAITANAFPEDVQACIEAGMNRFVAKPISRSVLLTTILDVMGMRPVQVDLITPPSGERAAQPALDAAAFAELQDMIGDDGMAEMLAVFTAEMGRRLKWFAGGPDDRDTLIREVHSIKGSAGTVCAANLAASAAEIEARLRGGGDWDGTDGERLKVAFEAYLLAPDVARHLREQVA
ncbi:MAG: ATP-binding protein [Acetobacteraceae bacterium]